MFWISLLIVFLLPFVWSRLYYHPSNRTDLRLKLLSTAGYFGMMALLLVGLTISNEMDVWSFLQKISLLMAMPLGLITGRMTLRNL